LSGLDIEEYLSAVVLVNFECGRRTWGRESLHKSSPICWNANMDILEVACLFRLIMLTDAKKDTTAQLKF
jgi:hypothetical protein